MIQLTVRRDNSGEITSFTLSGHACFAEPGEDIVCAGVSAVSFGMINAMEQLLNVQLDIEMEEESGFLHCVLPRSLDMETHEKAQLLAEAMLVSVEAIALEYGKYVSIQTESGR